MAPTFPTLLADRVYTARDVAGAVRKAGRTNVDEQDVRKYVRTNSIALTGDDWPEDTTKHRYSPALARDIAAAMVSAGAQTATVVSKRERTKPDAS